MYCMYRVCGLVPLHGVVVAVAAVAGAKDLAEVANSEPHGARLQAAAARRPADGPGQADPVAAEPAGVPGTLAAAGASAAASAAASADASAGAGAADGGPEAPAHPAYVLVVVDGTWRQAKEMFKVGAGSGGGYLDISPRDGDAWLPRKALGYQGVLHIRLGGLLFIPDGWLLSTSDDSRPYGPTSTRLLPSITTTTTQHVAGRCLPPGGPGVQVRDALLRSRASRAVLVLTIFLPRMPSITNAAGMSGS